MISARSRPYNRRVLLAQRGDGLLTVGQVRHQRAATLDVEQPVEGLPGAPGQRVQHADLEHLREGGGAAAQQGILDRLDRFGEGFRRHGGHGVQGRRQGAGPLVVADHAVEFPTDGFAELTRDLFGHRRQGVDLRDDPVQLADGGLRGARGDAEDPDLEDPLGRLDGVGGILTESAALGERDHLGVLVDEGHHQSLLVAGQVDTFDCVVLLANWWGGHG